MITDIVIRYAENINYENKLADFLRYSIHGDSVAAVSWELPGEPRRKGGEYLLKKMAEKIHSDVNSGILHVMIELSGEQPDNAIVNYKKTWGLLKSRGIRVDDITDKKDFIRKGENGLILSCYGTVDLLSDGVIQSLFNCEEKVYFSLFSPKYKWTPNENSLSGWMESVWEINGIVFMLMGYFDEKDCELVALGRQGVLKNYFLTQQ